MEVTTRSIGVDGSLQALKACTEDRPGLERCQVKALNFRSTFHHTLDGKGRTSVPSRFREIFAELAREATGTEEETIVLTRHVDPCLIAFPPSAWFAFEAKVAELPQLSRKATLLKRVFIAHAEECPIDAHGRIRISQPLRSFAALEREVIWVGQINNCEIWSPTRWDEYLRKRTADEAVMAEALDELDDLPF